MTVGIYGSSSQTSTLDLTAGICKKIICYNLNHRSNAITIIVSLGNFGHGAISVNKSSKNNFGRIDNF